MGKSSEFSYEELYGCSIGEYDKFLYERLSGIGEEGFSAAKTAADIELLEKNYKRLVERRNEDHVCDLLSAIRKLIEKKRKHYKRLEDWNKKRR